MAAVLLVDDDADQLEFRRLILERAGFEVASASGPDQALAEAETPGTRVVVMDLKLPTVAAGLALIRRLPDAAPSACIVILSGAPEALDGHPEAALVSHVLRKPVRSAQLTRLLSGLAAGA